MDSALRPARRRALSGLCPGARVTDVRVDVIEFCLLAGGRREVSTLTAEITGNIEAGRDVLVAAASLARP